MKMKILRRVILVTCLAAVIVAIYVRLSAKPSKDEELPTDGSVVGQLLAIDMDLNYPANPRDVVVLYSRIIKAVYGEQYTDDQLIGLAQHMRAMFDEELIANGNDYDSYMQRLREEIAAYALNKKTISNYIVQRSSDVELLIDDKKQYARVKALYYTIENTSIHNKVYEQYTLRLDDGGKWRILFWELIPETVIKGE